jgi:hypothetical protein
MNDQNGSKTETGEADSHPPSSNSDKNFSQNRVPPTIEGEAHDITPPDDANPPSPVAAETEPGQEAKKVDDDIAAAETVSTAAKEPVRKSGAFRPVAILIGAVAIGGGAYYLWDAYVATTSPPQEQVAETTAPPANLTEAPPKPTPVTPISPQEPPKGADKGPSETAPTPVADESKKIEPPAEAEPAGGKPIAPPATEAGKLAVGEEAQKTASETAAKLVAARSEIERLVQRVEKLEAQLAAPKNGARASLMPRDAGPTNSGDAAARIVVAQSLLTALKQGDDYAAQLAALQNLGTDPSRLARLRAGLSAPTLNQLATDFSALAPKLAAASAPAKPAEEAKASRNSGESILAYLEAEARRLVRVRPAAAPETEASVTQIHKIENDLRSGDLNSALADREKLPANALALSADWATAAQARLDAEAAARAELSDALQNLNRAKT